MAKFIPVEPFNIVIFGGTGDLSKRKLLPALFHRFLDGQITADSRIVGSARSKLSRQDFQNIAKESCRKASEEKLNFDNWTDFSNLLDYQSLNATEPGDAWRELTEKLGNLKDRPTIFYLATSPNLYVQICESIKNANLVHPRSRVVLEKPIGTDLESAKLINSGVGAVFDERQIYRIDHYLGKESVQNLLVLRFANTMFEPLWSRTSIDNIQINVSESIGVAGRAGYYDQSGALRDMVQNHLLQLLCLTAMEPPNTLNDDNIRTEKLKVLTALKPITVQDAPHKTVRAQYRANTVEGEDMAGYQEELGEDSLSNTETFVAIKAEIGNWRWAGVPFYLRTGKRMSSRNSEIIIQFKTAPHEMFGNAGLTEGNKLVIRLQPDEGVRLFVQIKEPGPGGLRIKLLPLNLSYAENFMVRYPDAYERLLMDVVRGNLSLFMRREEVEAAWRWADGLLQAWEDSGTPLTYYLAGTDGPPASEQMLARDGRTWSSEIE